MRKTIIVLALVTAAAGCAGRYTSQPPLPFERFPYTSLKGEPWPLKTLALESTAATLGMPVAPQLAYVELNPESTRTVLLIHGLGSYLKFWRYQIDDLAARGYRVVAID